jgi:hypothetical protein
MVVGVPSQRLKKPFTFERQKGNVLGLKLPKSISVRSLAYLVIITTKLQLKFNYFYHILYILPFKFANYITKLLEEILFISLWENHVLYNLSYATKKYPWQLELVAKDMISHSNFDLTIMTMDANRVQINYFYNYY